MKMFTWSLLVFLYGEALTQSLDYPLGARSIGMGNCSLTKQDSWGCFNNQAAVSRLENISTVLFFENKHLLPDLNRTALGVIVPLKRGGLMASIDHFGGGLYSETKAGIGYSIPFGEHFSTGIKLDYMLMAIGEGHGNYHSVTFEAGILALLNEKLSFAVHVFNPIIAGWQTTEEKIQVMFRAGLSFDPEPELSLHIEIHKSNTQKAVCCFGTEYHFRKKFFIRAGITTGPASYSFGAGYRMKRLQVDIASSIHRWLGYSPQVSFTYNFKR